MTIHIHLFNQCFRNSNRSNHKNIDNKLIFQKGLEKMNADLNLINILETISKLKSTAAVLVGSNKEVVDCI
jgi:hypothetical protein